MAIKQDPVAETTRRAFGAVLTSQGRGYYVALELLAIAWGTQAAGDGILPSSDLSTLRYARRSHDFARRWINDGAFDDEKGLVKGPDGEAILRSLLSSLRVPIPNRRTMPGWLGQHLYPYVGELIHYDATERRNNAIQLERYAYRGAGGLAHMILRSDPDSQRLAANRVGLEELVSDSSGPLGQLANACSSHDRATESAPFVDDKEPTSIVDPTPWVDHLRDGVRNITARKLARAKKVELLMLWVPYCIARHQLDRAADIQGAEYVAVPAALVQRNSPVRNIARRELDRARGLVDEALQTQATRLAEGASDEEAELYQRVLHSQTKRTPVTGFFTQTLATVGSLNAFVGTRYLTIKLPLLEAMVSASLTPGEEVEFHAYCRDVLWKKYRLVVDGQAELLDGQLGRLDSADLAENAEGLARDLGGLGLLTAFSDATRMVSGEVR